MCLLNFNVCLLFVFLTCARLQPNPPRPYVTSVKARLFPEQAVDTYTDKCTHTHAYPSARAHTHTSASEQILTDFKSQTGLFLPLTFPSHGFPSQRRKEIPEFHSQPNEDPYQLMAHFNIKCHQLIRSKYTFPDSVAHNQRVDPFRYWNPRPSPWRPGTTQQPPEPPSPPVYLKA